MHIKSYFKKWFFFYLTICFGIINFVQNNNIVISLKLFFYLNQSKFLQSNKIELKNGLKISTTAKRFCKWLSSAVCPELTMQKWVHVGSHERRCPPTTRAASPPTPVLLKNWGSYSTYGRVIEGSYSTFGRVIEARPLRNSLSIGSYKW